MDKYSSLSDADYILKISKMNPGQVLQITKAYPKKWVLHWAFWKRLTKLDSKDFYKLENGGILKPDDIQCLELILKKAESIIKIVWGLHMDEPSWLLAMIPRYFPRIQSINMNCFNVLYENIKHLGFCTSLRSLSLVLPDIFPDHILTTIFRKNCALNTVKIYGEFTKANVLALPITVQHLEVVGFNKNACTLKSSEFLERIHRLKLTYLALHGIHQDLYFDYVNDLARIQKNLEHLEIVFSVNLLHLNLLKELRSLTILNDDNSFKGWQLKELAMNCNNLKILHIGGIYVSSMSMWYLSQLPKLLNLEFTNCFITSGACQIFSEFKILTSLKLAWEHTEGNYLLNNSDIMNIVYGAKNLCKLDLADIETTTLTFDIRQSLFAWARGNRKRGVLKVYMNIPGVSKGTPSFKMKQGCLQIYY